MIKPRLMDNILSSILIKFFAAGMEKIWFLIPKQILCFLVRKLCIKYQHPLSNFLNMDAESFKKYIEKGLSEINKYNILGLLRSAFFSNGIIRPLIRKRFFTKYNMKIPCMIAFSVTNKCNLKCFGCYSSEHFKDTIPYNIVKNKIVKAGNTLGVGFFTVLGGEPLLYPQIIDLVKNNRSSYFFIYTNGYYLDEKMADFFSKAGNVGIFFGMAGYRKSTDKQRGDGTFDIVREKMKMLKDRKTPFGISILVTRENWEEVSSLSFIDDIISWGGYNLSYFLYFPFGRDPKIDLVLNCKERANFNDRINLIIKTKPLWILNEMNRSCWAGASNRGMLHINAAGDIEPCIGIHFSTHNIFTSTLVDTIHSKLFLDIQKINSKIKSRCLMHDALGDVINCCSLLHASPTQNKAAKQYSDFIQEKEK